MAKVHFTARWVQTVKPPITRRLEDYFDRSPPNLALRVTATGHKSWYIMYRMGQRLRRHTLGTYPALSLANARRLAAEARSVIAHGMDPATQKQAARHGITVGEFTAAYMEHHAKVHKKSWRDDQRLLTREVLTHWRHHAAADIRRRDVLALLDRIVARGAPIQANRVLALIRKVFNWGIGRELVESNPCTQITPPGKEHKRERVLTEAEIRRIWQVCDTLPPYDSRCSNYTS